MHIEVIVCNVSVVFWDTVYLFKHGVYWIFDLACSANLLEGLYILPMLFLYFLMVDFLDPVAQNLMEQSSPKFQDW